MSCLVLRTVIEHVLASPRQCLDSGHVSVELRQVAADAVADLMLDAGCRLIEECLDGDEVAQNYVCARTGRLLGFLGITAIRTQQKSRSAIAFLVRGTNSIPVSASAFNGSHLVGGTWYSEIGLATTIHDLVLLVTGAHAFAPVDQLKMVA